MVVDCPTRTIFSNASFYPEGANHPQNGTANEMRKAGGVKGKPEVEN